MDGYYSLLSVNRLKAPGVHLSLFFFVSGALCCHVVYLCHVCIYFKHLLNANIFQTNKQLSLHVATRSAFTSHATQVEADVTFTKNKKSQNISNLLHRSDH